MEGSNQATLSPDEKNFVILYSYSNKPTELFWQENTRGKSATQVTNKARSNEFRSYPWRDPDLEPLKQGMQRYMAGYITVKPGSKKTAVIFVHGAATCRCT